MRRQLKLIMRNPNTLTRVINAFIFGVVLGMQLPIMAF